MPEKSGYLVRVETGLGSVLLDRHLLPVEALDFQNELRYEMQGGRKRWTIDRPITIPEEECLGMVTEGEVLYVFDAAARYYRFFKRRRFTELFIVHEVEDTKNLTEQETKRYKGILDRFVFAYRAFTGDVSVRMPNDLVGDYPVIRAGTHEYSDQELQAPEPERITTLPPIDIGVEVLPLGFNIHEIKQPAVDPERTGPLMSAFLASGDSVPDAYSLLVKALEELKIANDYRYALLLGFFSIEQVITDLLRHIKESAGISNKTLKEYEGEVGMSYKINVELPLVFKPDHPVRQLIPDLKNANSIRNKVVHEGRKVTYDEAEAVITAADKLIKALR
ncbi:MAG TPA: hypothetical protein VKV17_17935 [Bryobacteraceae bacterium]|nr:hypothetical protein [Bryobacteraceae bacterium]